MAIIVGVAVGLFSYYAGLVIIVAVLSRFLGQLPRAIPRKILATPRQLFAAILIAPPLEEVCFRGPLLLVAMIFGTKSFLTIGLLIAGSVIFGALHLTATAQFSDSGWTVGERRRMAALSAIITAWLGLVLGLLTLFYLNLLPAILTHAAVITVVWFRRK